MIDVTHNPLPPQKKGAGATEISRRLAIFFRDVQLLDDFLSLFPAYTMKLLLYWELWLRKVYYRIRVVMSDCKICKNVFKENGWNVDKVELQFATTKWIYVYDKLFGIIISCAFRKLYFYVRTYITVCEFDYFTT